MPRMNRRRMNRRKPQARRPKRLVSRNRIARQVHSYKRIVNLGTYVASQSPATGYAPAKGAFSFNMNLVPNAAEYSALYDQYKINGVSLRFIPKTNQFQGGTSGTQNALGYGQVITVLDYDDSGTPISKDALLEFGSAKVSRSNQIHKRYFKPKMLNLAFINAGTNGYSVGPARWLDWNQSTVEHYGVKWWIDAPTVPNTATDSSSIAYDVYATFYFQCKNTK